MPRLPVLCVLVAVLAGSATWPAEALRARTTEPSGTAALAAGTSALDTLRGMIPSEPSAAILKRTGPANPTGPIVDSAQLVLPGGDDALARQVGDLVLPAFVPRSVARGQQSAMPIQLAQWDTFGQVGEPSIWRKMGDSISESAPVRGIKSAWGKMTSAAKKPTAAPDDDPVSLSSKPVDPDADFYVAFARIQERAGNVDGARQKYEDALRKYPGHLGALSGLARLLDQTGDHREATRRYEELVRRHPQEAGAYNDLGLCYAKQGRLDDSLRALGTAVQLDPTKKLYRNNIATVLVEMNRQDEALRHLAVVNPPAVAHYNLGYLLNQKGDTTAAIVEFERALSIDPELSSAAHWHRTLVAARGGYHRTAAAPPAGAAPRDGGENITRRPPADTYRQPPRGPAAESNPAAPRGSEYPPAGDLPAGGGAYPSTGDSYRAPAPHDRPQPPAAPAERPHPPLESNERPHPPVAPAMPNAAVVPTHRPEPSADDWYPSDTTGVGPATAASTGNTPAPTAPATGNTSAPTAPATGNTPAPTAPAATTAPTSPPTTPPPTAPPRGDRGPQSPASGPRTADAPVAPPRADAPVTAVPSAPSDRRGDEADRNERVLPVVPFQPEYFPPSRY